MVGHGGRPSHGSAQLFSIFCLQNGVFNYILSKNQKLNKMGKLTSIFNGKVEMVEIEEHGGWSREVELG